MPNDNFCDGTSTRMIDILQEEESLKSISQAASRNHGSHALLFLTLLRLEFTETLGGDTA